MSTEAVIVEFDPNMPERIRPQTISVAELMSPSCRARAAARADHPRPGARDALRPARARQDARGAGHRLGRRLGRELPEVARRRPRRVSSMSTARCRPPACRSDCA